MQELHPKELKRVRFSFPLGSTSFILPNSCKITSPTSVHHLSITGTNSPEGSSSQLSIRDTIDLYLSLCRSREEFPNGRFVQLLEVSESKVPLVTVLLGSGKYSAKHRLHQYER